MSESEKTIQEQCYGTCWGAQQRIDELTQQLNAANERIKRLESVENSHAAVLNAIDNWMRQHQAKEAKPCIKQLKTKSCIYCMKVECECSDFDVSADMGAKG